MRRRLKMINWRIGRALAHYLLRAIIETQVPANICIAAQLAWPSIIQVSDTTQLALRIPRIGGDLIAKPPHQFRCTVNPPPQQNTQANLSFQHQDST
ncbi:MAG TPA: hypothetical protein VNX46_07185 [Candidatus Acidoferrum sp.]|jgi:hypothetical protein|nr:hypothetical protein [Candidatus Acidoferrum sp.]